jgi:hypothetical protein
LDLAGADDKTDKAANLNDFYTKAQNYIRKDYKRGATFCPEIDNVIHFKNLKRAGYPGGTDRHIKCYSVMFGEKLGDDYYMIRFMDFPGSDVK